MSILNGKGSLFVTRPSMVHYLLTPEEFRMRAADVFDVVAKGVVTVEINQHYPLADAVRAHQDLEGRKTTGATVLVP